MSRPETITVRSVEPNAEPWLRGILPELHPVIGHLVRASQQIREDLGQALATLNPGDIWARPHGMTSAGFHAKHLAGSTQRLCAYLEGRTLSEAEIRDIPQESIGNETAAELIAGVNEALDRYEVDVRALDANDFATTRHVGRARLPVTAVGLAIHIAEHGQRHVGQAIAAAKLTKALRNG